MMTDWNSDIEAAPRDILLSLEELAAKKLPHAPTFRKAADEITRLRADLAAVTAERDRLAARLAPVDDEELIEVAAYYFTDGSSWSALSERLRNTCRKDARNVIAAIRPHIEAAERERCAKVAEDQYYLMKNKQYISPEWMNGYVSSARDIAAAIRRGK